MVMSLSFSGGVSHKDPIPEEKQTELAGKIAALVKAAVETNACGGSGSVTVGTKTATISATSTYSV
jgi:hypothetical protein